MMITPTALKDVKIVTVPVYGDARGFFSESFHGARYAQELTDLPFVQDNVSYNLTKGALRGLHLQREPHAQGKLVSVLAGSVYDVAVDVRPDSPDHGKHIGVTLRAPYQDQDGVWQWQQLWIPPGFAHGYLALEDETLFSYKCTDYYAKDAEAGVLWSDPAIGITWPTLSCDFIISDKDTHHPLLKDFVL